MNGFHGGEKVGELSREVFFGIIIAENLDNSNKLRFDFDNKVLKDSNSE